MISLLDQAVSLGLLKPLDVQFANVVAAKDEPDILLAAAFLSAKVRAGHVCLMLDQLQKEQFFAKRQPELAEAIWLAAGQPDSVRWRQRFMTCAAVGDGSSATPIVLQGQRLYLQRMWRSESLVASFIGGTHKHPIVDKVRLRAILDRVFGTDTSEINWQKIATAVALTRRISVISGGPGTGKTTTVAKLLAALIQLNENARLRIQLAAPTGKAAARLTNSLSIASRNLKITPVQKVLLPIKATTLHRLLGAQPNNQRMRYHRENPLHLDVLVVDEASMVDLSMMARLIVALPERAQVIFLGDRDQLASVEAGAVLSDICRFAEQGYSNARALELSYLTGFPLQGRQERKTVTVCDSLCLLRKSYRFDAKSGIGQLSKVVNIGDVSRAREIINGNFSDIASYSLATIEEYQALLAACVMEYCDYLKQVHAGIDAVRALAAFDSFQVLCALREGKFGVISLNQLIESGLRNAGLINQSLDCWYHGRPIIIGCNNCELGLYNGDVGIALRDKRGELRVHFFLPNGSVKSVQPSRLPVHETAYAMTVHKSQGSEFDHALLVLPTQFLPLLSRELVYTAITRARTRLSLYAADEVLMKAICTPTQRCSGLTERLRNEDRGRYNSSTG